LVRKKVEILKVDKYIVLQMGEEYVLLNSLRLIEFLK
jgi:hypothetical protein